MRKRSCHLQVKKEHLIAFSIPVHLRCFDKSLARHYAGVLVINAKKYGIWVRYLNSDEWDFCILKKVSHFRSNALIRLKLDGEIDAQVCQALCIFKRDFDAKAILDLNQIYWPRCGSPAQPLRERTAK